MFGLFRKKATDDVEILVRRVGECEPKGDYVRLSEAYYQLGNAYLSQRKDKERAMMYFERASALYDNLEEVDSRLPERIKESCSEKISELEADETLLENELYSEVQEKAYELSGNQICVWNLLSLARIQSLFQKLSGLPGAGFLADTALIADYILKSVYEPLNETETEQIREYEDKLYAYGESTDYMNTGSQIPAGEGRVFQVFDLNGMNTFTQLYLFLDKFVDVSAPEMDADLIPCMLLKDYYLRSFEGEIHGLELVNAEIKRIWDDYEFVRDMPGRREVEFRIEEYRTLNMLGNG